MQWRKRTSTADLPASSIEPRSTVLLLEVQKANDAVRKHAMLPLDDVCIPYCPASRAYTGADLGLNGRPPEEVANRRTGRTARGVTRYLDRLDWGAKLWLRVMSEMKNIPISVINGLKGFAEAIGAVSPRLWCRCASCLDAKSDPAGAAWELPR